MRVTKVMREYVEKQLDEKRYALGKEYRASYDARRKECSDLIKEKVKAFREEIDAILVSYDMDNPAIKREKKMAIILAKLFASMITISLILRK